MSVVSKPALEAAGPPQVRTSRRWTTIAALLCAFIAGAAVGTVVTINALHDQRAQMFRHPEKARDEFAAQLRSRLDLTPEQDQEITAIIVAGHDKFEEFRCQVHPQIAAIFDGMEADIAAKLRPDQQATFREVIEERHRMFPPPPKLREKNKQK